MKEFRYLGDDLLSILSFFLAAGKSAQLTIFKNFQLLIIFNFHNLKKVAANNEELFTQTAFLS